VTGEGTLPTEILATLHPAIRIRCLRIWLASELHLTQLSAAHLAAVDELVTNWRGQEAIHVPGGTVERDGGALRVEARANGLSVP
jgi:tRNA(Ile)-lysidine synthase